MPNLGREVCSTGSQLEAILGDSIAAVSVPTRSECSAAISCKSCIGPKKQPKVCTRPLSCLNPEALNR